MSEAARTTASPAAIWLIVIIMPIMAATHAGALGADTADEDMTRASQNRRHDANYR